MYLLVHQINLLKIIKTKVIIKNFFKSFVYLRNSNKKFNPF